MQKGIADMMQKTCAKQQPNTSNHWKLATNRQDNIHDSTAVIDNRPANDATKPFSSVRSIFAFGDGLGDILHTENHRQLEASDIDVLNIANQAPAACDATIKIASAARHTLATQTPVGCRSNK
jgi:hypothetical protein